jgi:diguanylate cyclase (GGDEF)-like protein
VGRNAWSDQGGHAAANGALIRARSTTDLTTGYRRLAETLAFVLSQHDVEDVLARVATTLTELVPAEGLIVWRLEGEELVPALVQGEDAELMGSLRLPLGVGVTGLTVLTRKPIRSNDLHRDPRAWLVPGTADEPEALVCVPLCAGKTLLGALSLYRSGPARGFGREEFELACHFGEVAAIAIDNASTHAELARRATTDDLTGIANRRRFREQLERELVAMNRHHLPLSLLLFDVDAFKEINDTYGHQVGDEVLKTVAATLVDGLRANDTVARIGGDEFAALLPCTARADALRTGLKLQARIAASRDDLPVSACFGVSSLNPGVTGNLLAEADKLLYEAKSARASSQATAGAAR